MRNRNEVEEPQEEGAPAWMNTYGDMVTLLLTFFVLLFSFSTIDAQKWQALVSSLSGTAIVSIQSINPNDVNMSGHSKTEDEEQVTQSPDEQMDMNNPGVSASPTNSNTGNAEDPRARFNELYDKIKNHIEENKLQYMLNIYMQDDLILIRMTDSAFFDSGKTNIRNDSAVTLLGLCDIIQKYVDLIAEIQIVGHTDNVPIKNAKYQDNLELSMDRAASVDRFICANIDINPALLTPYGRGEYDPVESNDTEEGRAANRRVDFIIKSILID